MITIVEPHYYWPETTNVEGILQHIERCGRVCYKSEERITDSSSEKFVRNLVKSGHESVLEHSSISIGIVCSRAASHQLVRHRIAAYSQESQRFCNYGKNDSLNVICPPSIGVLPGDIDFNYITSTFTCNGRAIFTTIAQENWLTLVEINYAEYLNELERGILPEDARYILPNATKTDLMCTFNLRQWRHVFKERALNKHAQWEIRSIFSKLLEEFKELLPPVFDDLLAQ
jgi:thymidylate synthase (FAD)